jgi:tetraacyldisaccharide 4'-kinase
VTGGVERWLLRLWYGGASPADRLIGALLAPIALPLSTIVAFVARRRRRRIVRQGASDRPQVIVVGNLVAGGAGKTPTTIALARALTARGHRVGLLGRGYRRRDDDETLLVDADSAVDEAGDEPLVLARATGLPVAVGVDRSAALARLARERPECTVAIADDGLQHTRLPRRLELVVVDERGFGNGRCLPAGPLREPVDRLSSIDAIVLHRCDRLPSAASRFMVPGPGGSAPPPQFRIESRIGRFRALDDGTAWTPAAFSALLRERGATAAAVAGIARPERFFDDLAALGIDARRHPLADHARIDAGWLDGLAVDWVLMTAKDAVKLGPARADAHAPRRVVAEQEATLDEALINWVCDRLPAAGPAR